MLLSRGNSSPLPDVIFEAAEDLYSNASLMFTKGAHKRILITRPRVASSYCHEFCGIVGVPYTSVRFTLDSRPLNPEMYLSTPCIVKVHHSCEILQSSQNTLQPALLELLTSGVQSDLVLAVRGSEFKVHKCILMCRSAKFNAMFSTSLLEANSARVEIDADPVLFDKLLKWIYSGSSLMPEDVEQICELLLMADQYFLTDLKLRCEEDLVSKITPYNVIELMVAAQRLPLVTDSLMTECKEVFVKEFNTVKELQPQMEERIASVPGLMTQLFAHFHRASSKAKKKRRVTFRINEGIVDTHDDVSTVNSGYSSSASLYA